MAFIKYRLQINNKYELFIIIIIIMIARVLKKS